MTQSVIQNLADEANYEDLLDKTETLRYPMSKPRHQYVVGLLSL